MLSQETIRCLKTMTEQIYSENSKKIMKNKSLIEKELNIKLSSKENIIYIDGKPEEEYFALQIIEAINLGFTIKKALLLKDPEFTFNQIPIKSVTKRQDLERIRGRIIGKHRKALDTIESLTECDISLHDNVIGIIGLAQDVEKASYALQNLIRGSKHSSVFSYLEKQRALEKTKL